MDIVAVVWTFNPRLDLLERVLESVRGQVARVVVVDNGSRNHAEVAGLCRRLGCAFIGLGVNAGVEALNVGIVYAVKRYDPEFILLLDQDTVLREGAIEEALTAVRGLKLYRRVGALCLANASNGERELSLRGCFRFTGSFVKAELVKEGLRIRGEFFLDQADFDFFWRIRQMNYLTLAYYGRYLLKHILGTPLRIGKKVKSYEPPWRYYYLVRNSTILLRERKIDPYFYFKQLLAFFYPIIFVDGFAAAIKALGVGLIHGLIGKTGIIDPRAVGLRHS